MRCEQVRVALSARLDGEDPGPSAAGVEGHLGSCPACRTWLAGARRLAEAVRPRTTGPQPERGAAILAAVAADRQRAARRGRPARPDRRVVLRAAVGCLALAQLLPALADVVAVPGVHVHHEMGAFDAAVAVGFLVAAVRPALARAYLPVALALAAGLLVTSGDDIVRGITTLGHESAHSVCVAQAALLALLARTERRSRPRPAMP